MRPLGIRWRLTLWYAGLVAVVLLVFCGIVYTFMRQVFWMDEPLMAELSELSQLVSRAKTTDEAVEQCERYFRLREGYRFEVRTASGHVLFRSRRLELRDLPLPDLSEEDDEPIVVNRQIGGIGHFRVATDSVAGPGGPLIVQAALSLAPHDLQLWHLWIVSWITVPIALVCALVGGYVLARKTLAPVEEMGQTASMITAQDLNRRIPVVNRDDELGRLAQTLNHMIARLERSFEEVRRFTADAAHELRTPLAIMRSEAEIALRSPRPPEEYRRVIESMLEETTHLARMAEQLLFLCREDAGLWSGAGEIVPVSELLDDVAEQMQVAAAQRKVSITGQTERGCYINGDLQRIRRLFLNLLDNAIKYTHDGGSVRVTCARVGDRVEAIVEDTGCGIPAEYLPFIFDRFYRVDSSRNPEVKGTGLGLAICRSIVEAHRGTIDVRSTVGLGTRFKISFPAVAVSDAEPSDGEAMPATANKSELSYSTPDDG